MLYIILAKPTNMNIKNDENNPRRPRPSQYDMNMVYSEKYKPG